MSFLSVLGKIGKYAGLGAAGLATGGAAWIPLAASIAKDVGGLAGGASRQRAEDRGAQGEYDLMRTSTQNRDALENSIAKRQAEQARMKQVAGADMLGNFKTPTDPRAAKFLGEGGALPGGQVNPETIAMMRERAMKALATGSDTPQLQTMPMKPGGGATGMDTFLNTLNMGSTALGALGQAGIFNRGNGEEQVSSVNAPKNLEAEIFARQREDDVPYWSPLRRGNGN